MISLLLLALLNALNVSGNLQTPLDDEKATVTVTSTFFPPASVIGYPGKTPTGNEPFVVATAPAPPFQSAYFPLVKPNIPSSDESFNLFGTSWGNLSPFQSLPPATFSPELEKSSSLIPPGCTLEQVHLLHRHGARYPSAGDTAPDFGTKFANASFTSSGPLSFLSSWKYGLGAEILTPFGRQELFDLGVSFRLKYGHLLQSFSHGTLPVFRTTSEDRMVKSALNFAAGFWGIPYEEQYAQEIIVEAHGFNNTLAPYETCTNANLPSIGWVGDDAAAVWIEVYLTNATARLNAMVHGIHFTVADVYAMQQLCAYETVAVGYSDFCGLFTQEEWEGFEYAIDLSFWYSEAFGNPTTFALGMGWVSELVSRLSRTPLTAFNTSTNSTLDSNPITFPLHQPIYVDATHDVVLANILVALNVSSLAASGPLPLTYAQKNRSFRVSQIAPFAAHLVTQVLSCHSRDTATSASESKSYIRLLLNDASLPLTNIPGCPSDPYGRCEVHTWVEAMRERMGEVEWARDCLGNYPTFDVIGAGLVDGRLPRNVSVNEM